MVGFPVRSRFIPIAALLCVLTLAIGCNGDPNAAESTTDIFQSNLLILLDTSSAMDEPFESVTKIQAAVTVINEQVAKLQGQSLGQLALRRYGGPCQGANSELLYAFDETDTDTFRNLLDNIEASGETTLV